jgi:UDP-glucose:(heptosyl)LPS alpha-1,3-glucosyltransferase
VRVALTHLRHSGTGGTERYLNQMAAHLAEGGHEVTIVCRSHETAPHPDVQFAVLRNLTAGGAWRMWAFARAVEQHVRTAAYDIVFGLGRCWTQDVIRLGGGCHQTYLDAAHEATRRPWERVLRAGRLKHRVTLAIEARALSPGAYARVITNSEMVKRDVMRRYAVPEQRVAVIYNGVDLQRFHPRLRVSRGQDLRRACGFSEDDVVVLFLGTGYGRKGLGRVLEAFPELLRARPQARLLVVGYDSARPAFERRAAALGIAAQACFLGGRRDPEVCFAAADLYALPTYYDPFANSTLEALASGLPVITTATNGASEALTHHVHGSILPADVDRDILLHALLLWTDRDRARAAGEAARALAERYPQAETVRASVAVLEAVLTEKCARRRGSGVGANARRTGECP